MQCTEDIERLDFFDKEYCESFNNGGGCQYINVCMEYKENANRH